MTRHHDLHNLSLPLNNGACSGSQCDPNDDNEGG